MRPRLRWRVWGDMKRRTTPARDVGKAHSSKLRSKARGHPARLLRWCNFDAFTQRQTNNASTAKMKQSSKLKQAGRQPWIVQQVVRTADTEARDEGLAAVQAFVRSSFRCSDLSRVWPRGEASVMAPRVHAGPAEPS